MNNLYNRLTDSRTFYRQRPNLISTYPLFVYNQMLPDDMRFPVDPETDFRAYRDYLPVFRLSRRFRGLNRYHRRPDHYRTH